MTHPCNCTRCPAFRLVCEGCPEPCRYSQCDGQCAACPVRCGRREDLDGWLESLGGLALDVPLRPQPQFRLTGYFPQLLNGLEVPAALQRAPDVGVGIAKVLTPRGQISRRALPWEFGPYNLRVQWGLNELTRLICVGNYLDDYLEQLWAAQGEGDVWLRVRVLGFDFATSLNFSIYLDDPRLEHLVNIKRTWLTVARMQATSSLIAIPHLQWATILDLQRQLHYAQEQGFHTLTLNLQMTKRQGWDVVATGLPLIQAQMPGVHLLFSGVVGLKRVELLARTFPTASFTSTTSHYLAQRRVRLQRDGVRLIKEPVDGHPDLILAENTHLYQEFLREVTGPAPVERRQVPAGEVALQEAFAEVTAALQDRFGFDAVAACDAFDLLAADPAVLAAFRVWLHTEEVDRGFHGSYPESPTVGELLDEGADPIDAFLHLGHLARQTDEEIEGARRCPMQPQRQPA